MDNNFGAMESGTNETSEAHAAKNQQDRDHLDGLERERHGLPYSKEQHEREMRRFEEMHELEQFAMRQYTNYTLTTLVFARDLDLHECREWNQVMEAVHDLENCAAVIWGTDVKSSRRVFVLFGWAKGTSLQQIEDVTLWGALEHLLQSQPHARHMALNTPDMIWNIGPRLKELIIICGSDQILSPPDPLLLFDLESLALRTIPLIGHDPPVEFTGYTQGVTVTSSGHCTVAMIFGWVDDERRRRFINPDEVSYGTGGGDEYELHVGSKMRELEAAGATVESYLCHLKTWYPPARSKTRKRRCLVM